MVRRDEGVDGGGGKTSVLTPPMSYPLHQFDNITQCHKYKVEVVLAHHTDILWALNVLPSTDPFPLMRWQVYREGSGNANQ